MPTLTASDTEQVLRVVATAEELGCDQLFTQDLLVELGQLIEADWVSYNELDRVRCREILNVSRPGEAEEEPETVGLPSPLWHTKVLIFDRGNGPDFTERDRAVLDQLRPHLARLWDAARTRRLLAASLRELDRADEHDPRGIVLLGAAGEIEFASPPAQRLLREYFSPASAGLLPAALVDWLESGAARPFTRRGRDRRLVVRRESDSLVLEEQAEEVPLTARERDVLSWVARGKTNAEIGELLWLAPGTVRKHLENVYGKLGVNTRTAAVARFLGLIDAEAS